MRSSDTEHTQNGNQNGGFQSVINLCGERCPETFVKARMALDELEEGDILEVVVDDQRSRNRIPRNMKNHGQKHLDTKEENGGWRLRFQKQNEGPSERWIVMD